MKKIKMLKEELKNYIIKELEQMGCRNIEFLDGEDNLAIVFFDCDNLISFRKEIPDWENSGIQLNPESKEVEGKGRGRRYKIEFKKI